MRCAFSESTVPSDVPWKMIIGGIGATATMGGAVVLPRMARMALVGLDADRYGGAECTPTAANISGYVAASTTAIAPPSERPVTYIRLGSTRHAAVSAATRRTIPARIAGSPCDRNWFAGRNQFQHRCGLCTGFVPDTPRRIRAGRPIGSTACWWRNPPTSVRTHAGRAAAERGWCGATRTGRIRGNSWNQPGRSSEIDATCRARAGGLPKALPCRIGRGPCPLDGGLSGPGLGGSREHLDGKDLDARSRRPALARPCRARDERLHEGGPGRPARSSSWHVILPLSGTAGDERGFPATDHRRCGPPDGTGVRRMAGRPTSLATPGSRLAHPRRDLSGKGGAEPPGVCDAPESVSDVCECPRSGYGNDIGPA